MVLPLPRAHSRLYARIDRLGDKAPPARASVLPYVIRVQYSTPLFPNTFL